MQTLRYPIELKKAEDGITATFPDMPYGVTCGNNVDELLINAADCLEEIIASLIADKKDIPLPSTIKGKRVVTLSPLFAAKVMLYTALREDNLTKADLARRLNWKYPQVDRLFDPHHASRISQLSAAFAALDKRIVISVENLH